MSRLRSPKDAKELRNKLLEDQKHEDPITHIKITQPVLDHQHFAPFKCRSVLQSEVNAFEGKVYNAYRRYIKHLTNKPLPEVLRELANYLEKDFNHMPVHHTGILDEVRVFKRLSSKTQIQILNALGIEPAPNAKKRIKQIRKALLENKITYDELKKYKD